MPGLPWTLGARPWGAGPAPAPFSRALWLRLPARPFPTQRGKPGHPLSTQKGRAGGRARGHGPAVKTYLEHERRGFLPPSLALLCGPTTGLSTPPRPPFHLPSQSISQRRPEVLLVRQDSRGARDRAGSTSRLGPGACLRAPPSAPPPPVSGPVPICLSAPEPRGRSKAFPMLTSAKR